VSLTEVQKGVYYPVSHYLILPLPNIKQVAHDIEKYKHKSKAFHILHTFNSVEEYLDKGNVSELRITQ
jgi:hypothetical protein